MGQYSLHSWLYKRVSSEYFLVDQVFMILILKSCWLSQKKLARAILTRNTKNYNQLTLIKIFFLIAFQRNSENCLAIITPPEHQDKKLRYTKQSGRFSFQSTSGNEYIFVLYDYDTNTILTHALKNRQFETLVEIWKITHHYFIANGHETKTYMFDKISGVNSQLASLSSHRCNATERTIYTFKNHF